MKTNCSYLFSSYISLELFSLLVILFLAVFSYVYLKSYKRSLLSIVAFVMVISGGVLNTWERLKTGCVRDDISFFGLFSFNVYDIIVTFGVTILALIQLTNYGKKDINSRR